jgi:hypothetical protein
MAGTLRQELVDEPVAGLGRVLDAGQHRLGALRNSSSVDGSGDLVEVVADAVQRDGVGLDGFDQRTDGIVLRAADQAGLAEGDGERGVADEPGELLATPLGLRGDDADCGRGEADWSSPPLARAPAGARPPPPSPLGRGQARTKPR